MAISLSKLIADPSKIRLLKGKTKKCSQCGTELTIAHE